MKIRKLYTIIAMLFPPLPNFHEADDEYAAYRIRLVIDGKLYVLDVLKGDDGFIEMIVGPLYSEDIINTNEYIQTDVPNRFVDKVDRLVEERRDWWFAVGKSGILNHIRFWRELLNRSSQDDPDWESFMEEFLSEN